MREGKERLIFDNYDIEQYRDIILADIKTLFQTATFCT